MSKPAILIVDDEAIILLSIKRELQNRFGPGFSYETALGAAEANEIIEELCEKDTPIILIISDWLMPGIKGDEFLEGVHRRHPKIPAILITGQADPESIERAKKELGVYACLQKPWNREDLWSLVDQCIKLSQEP